MAAGDIRIGMDAKLLQGAAGSTASVEAVNAEDVTLSMTAVEIDTTRRASLWETVKTVRKNAELSFTLQKREGDSVATAIVSAFMSGGRISLYPRDSTSGEGLNADWYITGITDGQPLKDKQTWAITAKPADEQRDPVWE